jgi:hypothetical protein
MQQLHVHWCGCQVCMHVHEHMVAVRAACDMTVKHLSGQPMAPLPTAVRQVQLLGPLVLLLTM